MDHALFIFLLKWGHMSTLTSHLNFPICPPFIFFTPYETISFHSLKFYPQDEKSIYIFCKNEKRDLGEREIHNFKTDS